VISQSVWVVGPSRSGKTTRLIEQFCIWVNIESSNSRKYYTQSSAKTGGRTNKRLNIRQSQPGVLVFAANEDNRRQLADKIVTATSGKYPVRAKTPLGFFQDEIILFWPLLIQSLKLKAQFPVRLRPETEQELATRLWHPHLDAEILQQAGVNEYRGVRRILDLLQLAAYSGNRSEEIERILTSGLATQENVPHMEPQLMANLLLNWRDWCLERGFLTYGIITELYSQHLLSDPNYQWHLAKRYQAVMADDVDDYPRVAGDLFNILFSQGAVGAFSYNPEGAVRLGLGADPEYLQGLAVHCQVETLNHPQSCLADTLATPMLQLLSDQIPLILPETVQLIETASRATLLRETAEAIIEAVKTGRVPPEEIAVIAPGLDAIARYTLGEILNKQGILVDSLNDQRPLISSPVIRALLTLLTLVYPHLGRLVDRDAVAEMLVVLGKETIDPVRAGLLADYCFEPHPERPNLLPVSAFDRWDRIGYTATKTYEQILQWLEGQRSQLISRLIPSPISFLDRAIQRFLWNGSNLPYEQLAALRELLETAQHYWEIDTRLRQYERAQADPHESDTSAHTTIAQFIQLLRRGTITANPYPMRPIGSASKTVTLATIFQYRSSRRCHRWHFWLDVGSPLWLQGGAATLFGAPFFLQQRLGRPWSAEEQQQADEQRLERILADLLARVSEKVYLCHSDLAVNGQEQLGPLLSLVNSCELKSPPEV
jgi:hypothetical protein